jgi:hypothetical protein
MVEEVATRVMGVVVVAHRRGRGGCRRREAEREEG